MQYNMQVINDGTYRSRHDFPQNLRMAFSGEEITAIVTKNTSISTVGPIDAVGFAKKPLTMLAEGLTYRMASKIASAKASGTVNLALRHRENGIGGGPSGTMKQDRHTVHGAKTFRLDPNKNYKIVAESRLPGVFDVKIIIKAFRNDLWA